MYCTSLVTNKQCKWLIFIFAIFITGCFEREPGVELAPVTQGGAKERPVYVSQQGDTLFSIAWAFDKDYKQLAYYNGLDSHSKLKVGQKIHLVSKGKIKPTQKPEKASTNIRRKSISRRRVNQKKTVKPDKLRLNRKWLWPARGYVTKRFNPVKQQKGINIQGKVGSKILASQPGIVAYSGNGLSGYGNLVIIRHSNRYLSAYAFNRKIFVKEGQQVKARQTIAEMGRSKGNKGLLHFEIRKYGKPKDPLKYLKK